MDQAAVVKYKDIVIRTLNKIEEITDSTGVLVNGEATKIERVAGRVKVDDDTMSALKALRKELGDCIRLIVEAHHEYDMLDAERDDLDAEVS